MQLAWLLLLWPAVPPGAAVAADPLTSPPAAAVSPAPPGGSTEAAAVEQSSAGYAYHYFDGLWRERRTAASRGDISAANAVAGQMVAAKAKSGWPDFFAYSDALAAESRAAVAAGETAAGLDLAKLAVALGPHRLRARLALASAHWSNGSSGEALGALSETLALLWREPPLWAARTGNLALAILIACAVAAWLFALVALLRHGAPLHHDMTHLLPSGASRRQAALFLVTALAAPILYRLGAMWACVLWLMLLTPYVARRERSAALVLLSLLLFIPALLPQATAHFAYPGSRAEELYVAARDAGAEDTAAVIAARETPLADELFVLGLRARWSGDIDRARAFYDHAVAAGALYPEVLISLGNVKYLAGDYSGAAEAYKQALAIDARHVLATFNLSQVYPLAGDVLRGGEARRKANELDRHQVAELTRLTTATGLLVAEAPVPRVLLARKAEVTLEHRLATSQLWQRMGGGGSHLGFTALVILAALWALALPYVTARLRPSARCSRCGVVVCRRCSPQNTGSQCATCAAAFAGEVAETPSQQHSRIQKEIESHRFYARRLKIARIGNLLISGSGQLVGGASLRGLFFIIAFVAAFLGVAVGVGIIPEPLPLYGGLGMVATVGYGVVALVFYVWALIDAQREEA